MTNTYRWVHWNPHKRIYDATPIGLVITYPVLFVALGTISFRPPHAPRH